MTSSAQELHTLSPISNGESAGTDGEWYVENGIDHQRSDLACGYVNMTLDP